MYNLFFSFFLKTKQNKTKQKQQIFLKKKKSSHPYYTFLKATMLTFWFHLEASMDFSNPQGTKL